MAAALAIRFRAAASVSNAGVTAEGPFGGKKRGSWLAVVRKSYLQYILARTFPDNTFIFGLEDAQTRLTYDFTPQQHADSLLAGELLQASTAAPSARPWEWNSIVNAGYHYTLANLGWRSAPFNGLLLVNHLAWMREKFDDHNPSQLPTSGGFYGEWVWNGSATWMWNARNPLKAGWSIRRLRSVRASTTAINRSPRRHAYWTVSMALLCAKVAICSNPGWRLPAGCASPRVPAGIITPWNNIAAISPAASASLGVTPSTSLLLAWGQYVQYPELFPADLNSRQPGPAAHPFQPRPPPGIEQRIGQRTRIRAGYYNRSDRDLPFQPLYDVRIVNNKVVAPPLNPPYVTSLSGYSSRL